MIRLRHRSSPWVDGDVPRPCRHASVLSTSASGIDGGHCWHRVSEMCDGGRAVHGGSLARPLMVKSAAGSGTSVDSVTGKGTGRPWRRPVAAITGERAGSRQRLKLGPVGVVGSSSRMGCAGIAVDLGSAVRHDERPGSSNPGLADDGNKYRWVLGKTTIVRVRSENGDDRRRGGRILMVMDEEDSPRVTSVINNVLIVAIVMSGLDRGDDGPAVVGSDDGELPFFDGELWSSSSSSSAGVAMGGTTGSGRGERRHQAVTGGVVRPPAVAAAAAMAAAHLMYMVEHRRCSMMF
ncbi:hypothetical protein ACLOJK_034993 [Asimina triloba]